MEADFIVKHQGGERRVICAHCDLDISKRLIEAAMIDMATVEALARQHEGGACLKAANRNV